jgi:hypothetical protein
MSETLTLDFTKLVDGLSKDGQEIIDQLTPKKAHAWHMATGLANELNEAEQADCNTDRNNMIEELGDIEFFAEGLRSVFDLTRTVVLASEILIEKIDFTDTIKKYVVYGKDIDLDELRSALLQVEFIAERYRFEYKITREETLQHCMKKLNKRYSSGSFSNEQAQTRADKQQ